MIMKSIYIILLLLFNYFLAIAFAQEDNEVTGNQNPGYLVSAPAIFRSGLDQSLSVRIFNHEEAVRVSVKIIDSRDEMIASASSDVEGSGVITLKIPSGKEGKAILHVCGNCHLPNSFNFHNSTPITVVNKGASAFIQTDKPVYKPQQSVMITVFSVNRDLRPLDANITAYVQSPDDVRMMEWKDLKPICCGTVQMTFPLSDQPPLGTWKIYAEIDNNVFKSTFEIRKYVLPKFEVEITPPSHFRSLHSCEAVTVRSKYTFGKELSGTLYVNATVAGVGYSQETMPTGRVFTRTMTINGEASFSICLSDMLDERHVDSHDRGALQIWATVTSEDGSSFTAYTDSTTVSRSKFEIEFTEATRKHFKPGMPFTGQIKTHHLNGEPTNNVIIRVKVEDIATIDALVVDDIATFTVPALPQSIQKIWLDARVVAIDNQNVAEDYLSTYMELISWSSPSNCHILAESPKGKLIPGENINFAVKSSCGCDFKLYFDVLSRGNLVKSGAIDFATNSNKKLLTARLANDGVCEGILPMHITPNMAPISRLLVYYKRKNGEGVADSIQLSVEPALENAVTITPNVETSIKPGMPIEIEVSATENSCVCLALVDKSVHLMKPGYFLNVEKIFEEMETYDMHNIPFKDDMSSNMWSVQPSYRSKRSIDTMPNNIPSRDAKFAFLETGLIVMTDTLILDQEIHNDLIRQASSLVKQGSRRFRTLRTFFPETWYSDCFQLESGSNILSLTVPDTITTWQANAIALNSQTGLGISQPQSIVSMKNFFVDFSLPYSAIRGEQLRVPFTIHNYMDRCVTARATILIPHSHVVFTGLPGESTLMKKVCIPPQSTSTQHVVVEFKNLGEKSMSAVVDAFEPSDGCCGVEQQLPLTRNRIISSDAVKRRITVEAEGDHQEYTHSVYVCPNERLNITTGPEMKYQFVNIAQGKIKFSFVVKAERDVHILLSNSTSTNEKSYEIILGGSLNFQSWISCDNRRLVTAATEQVLSNSEFRSFWVKWEKGNIEVGRGVEVLPETRFMQSLSSSMVNVDYIGFATGEGVQGQFRLWKSEKTGGNKLFLTLDLPPNFIRGSQKGYATVLGDIMGPTLKNLNQLLKLPCGCGEQNMVNFAPNIYILNYLKQTNQITETVFKKATQFLQQGYQRQLTYKRSDGSYSAFGDRDENGSMWLTSFVLKSFAKAREHIYIDAKEIHSAREWIMSWQENDGSFPSVGKILNRDLQGGVNSKISLTAYVVIALLESGVQEQNSAKVFTAITYLEKNVEFLQEPYSAALTTYALTLYKSPVAEEARKVLQDMGLLGFSNEIDHWSIDGAMDMPMELDPGEIVFGIGDSMKQSVSSANIEMTSFALLAYIAVGDVASSLPIVRWISKQRNELGGFSSTQDTCVALQALSHYATSAYIGGVNLQVFVASQGLDKTLYINSTNINVMQTVEIPQLPVEVFIATKGEGCALFQTNVKYNTPTPTEDPPFDLEIAMSRIPSVNPPGILNPKQTMQFKSCMRWKLQGASNMAVLEIPLLTGLTPKLESLESAISNRDGNLKRYELDGDKILFYFDEIPAMCKTCITFEAQISFKSGKVKSRSALVYDYYEPAHRASVFYHPLTEMQLDVTEEGILPRSTENEVPEGMQCSNSIVGCEAYEPKIITEEFDECKCYKECGFAGPLVCGTDGVSYLNRCRMKMAACEKGIEIEEQENMFECEKATMLLPDDIDGELQIPDLVPVPHDNEAYVLTEDYDDGDFAYPDAEYYT